MFGFFKRALARQSAAEAEKRKREAEKRRAAAMRSGAGEAPDFADMVDGFQGFGVSAPPVHVIRSSPAEPEEGSYIPMSRDRLFELQTRAREAAATADYTPIERHVASQGYDTTDYGRSCTSDSSSSSSSSSDSSSSCSGGE